MYNLVVVYVHPHVIEFCVICLTRPLSEMAFWVSTKLSRPIMNFLGIHEVARLGKAMQNYMIKTLGVWVLDTRCHFSISQINPGQNLPPFCWKSPKTVWVQTQWKLQYDTFPFSIEIHFLGLVIMGFVVPHGSLNLLIAWGRPQLCIAFGYCFWVFQHTEEGLSLFMQIPS